MPSGGPRTPTHPAAVSGPGAYARRTDGGAGQPIRDPGGLPYGENQELRTSQSSAPMSNTNVSAVATRTKGGNSVGAVTPFGAPTERPDEPVTTGNPFGPGEGPEALQMPMSFGQQSSRDAQELKKYLPSLERTANMPGVPQGFVRFVRHLRDI